MVFHVATLVGLANLLRRLEKTVNSSTARASTIYLFAIAVFVIIGLHTIESWARAGRYYFLGEFKDFGQALYFSVVTSTTLGNGDITLSDRWQLLGTFEVMGGLILFGTSTAFLLELMRSLFEETTRSNKAAE